MKLNVQRSMTSRVVSYRIDLAVGFENVYAWVSQQNTSDCHSNNFTKGVFVRNIVIHQKSESVYFYIGGLVAVHLSKIAATMVGYRLHLVQDGCLNIKMVIALPVVFNSFIYFNRIHFLLYMIEWKHEDNNSNTLPYLPYQPETKSLEFLDANVSKNEEHNELSMSDRTVNQGEPTNPTVDLGDKKGQFYK